MPFFEGNHEPQTPKSGNISHTKIGIGPRISFGFDGARAGIDVGHFPPGEEGSSQIGRASVDVLTGVRLQGDAGLQSESWRIQATDAGRVVAGAGFFVGRSEDELGPRGIRTVEISSNSVDIGAGVGFQVTRLAGVRVGVMESFGPDGSPQGGLLSVDAYLGRGLQASVNLRATFISENASAAGFYGRMAKLGPDGSTVALID